ncbi:peroxidase family protein [Caulobacter sp. RL271]|uniref:Heme peroxidase family protein n=1 Tax=Caulobacter segnis TaxID=88688 RepID=A0ABY4ZX59_9CAUL|nr:heme peroxidase family protein [Caulobacter segnis]USQ97366.1 heme peroxidase family protein [Caulobacter segnis]
MLLSLGHGDRIVLVDAASPADAQLAKAARTEPDRTAITGADAAVAPRARRGATATGEGDRFGYLFPGAASQPPVAGAKLDALADAMIDPAGGSAARSGLPPVMTYYGQFIDHDITANTDRENGKTFTIVGETITPLARDLVVSGITNLRHAKLDLDSLYGDGPLDHPLEAVMRNGAAMRVGAETNVTGQFPGMERPPLPVDTACDLPRVGPLVAAGLLDPTAVPPELLTPGQPPNQSRKALIGDGRNDENLVVAQLHTAMLRFHNVVVAELAPRNLPDRECFLEAQRFVRHVHQWLVINDYLPTVCDRATLADVLEAGAPLYKRFHEARQDQIPASALPMPLEFSVAGFRFGHSMIRNGYDYNRNFGAEAKILPFASLEQLFQFTGKSPTPFLGAPTLPNNWIAEWSRFTADLDAAHDARPIDTRLAPTLLALPNEGGAPEDLMKHLARRNLRRGWLLNLPSAQTLIAELAAAGLPVSRVLTRDELLSGATGAALVDGGFDEATPLWFYVLKEAEIVQGGERLGPLGSRIVAETLAGLVIADPDSYWNRQPNGTWRPSDELRPAGVDITRLTDLLHAAGVL